MNRLSSSLILILVFSLCTTDVRAQEQPWLSYYPSVARLNGKLTKVLKYGPPTYGESPETDKKMEVPILILRTPVRIKGNATSTINNEQITNVSFVQIIFPPELQTNYANYLEQDVVLAGTLTRGYRGEHFTDVVMTVKAVNPTGKPL
jgi:hypothetical protein